MAKAKYKLGTLIQFDDQHGVVGGVIARADGYHYEVGESEISESKVTAAFRPVASKSNAGKKQKTGKGTQSKATKSGTEAQEARAPF